MAEVVIHQRNDVAKTRRAEEVEFCLAAGGMYYRTPDGTWKCSKELNKCNKETPIAKSAPVRGESVEKSELFSKAAAIEAKMRDASRPMGERMPTSEGIVTIAKRDAFVAEDGIEHRPGMLFEEVLAAVHERAIAKLRTADPKLDYHSAYGLARKNDPTTRILYVLDGAAGRLDGLEFGKALQWAADRGGCQTLLAELANVVKGRA